jgi:hypothetical protein
VRFARHEIDALRKVGLEMSNVKHQKAIERSTPTPPCRQSDGDGTNGVNVSVPIAVIRRSAAIPTIDPYSITRSARSKIDCGTVRLSALAAFMLMASSNLVGCSIGRSPGFAPLSILSI